MARGMGNYHLKISSKRKEKFLELLATSKTMDISIEIDDDLKNSTTGKNDSLTTEVMTSSDIKDNGELKSSLF